MRRRSGPSWPFVSPTHVKYAIAPQSAISPSSSPTYIVVAHIAVVYIVMACIVMAYAVMAYVVMAYAVMAVGDQPEQLADLI